MGKFYGAKTDLNECIKTHLFLLCPNSSGSTFLSKALGTSHAVWGLPREGQHVFGFKGPNTGSMSGVQLIWGADDTAMALFSNPANYDWAEIKKAWYFQARGHSPRGPVFFTKAPPFIVYPDQLMGAFGDTKFLIMVRNPYAMLEGILRRRERLDGRGDDLVRRAARHVVKCFELQIENRARFADNSCFFTYEDMCARPLDIGRRIMEFVPAITDLNLDQTLPVKQMYNERLRNMNDEQIARLTGAEIDLANETFGPQKHLFSHFGYDFIEGKND